VADRRGGGITPVCRKGPDRAEVDPFEFVRAIGGAERWEMLLDRWEGTSIRSYFVIRATSGKRAIGGPYRGQLSSHSISSAGHTSRDIVSSTLLLLLLVDWGSLVLEGGSARREEGGYPGLNLCLLGEEHLELLVIDGSVDP
jgi:hypothetical protein